jgi:hypothetical protein
MTLSVPKGARLIALNMAVNGTPREETARRTLSVPEGARVIAMNMAMNGTPREETARCLQEDFDLGNTDAILDEVYG